LGNKILITKPSYGISVLRIYHEKPNDHQICYYTISINKLRTELSPRVSKQVVSGGN